MSATHLDRGRPAMDVFCSHASGVGRLVHEIGAAHMGIKNALRARAEHRHADWAMTKTELTSRLLRLEGMISAWMAVTGRWPYGGIPARDDSELCVTAREVLHISLPRLREDVKNA